MMLVRPDRRPLAAVFAATALALSLSGCSAAPDASIVADPLAVGALGPGFTDPAAPPAPESTIAPSPGSWDDVHPPQGYRVVLLTAGGDAATTTLVTAVERWAESEGVHLDTVSAAEAAGDVDAIVEAMDLAPDVIISAGNRLVDPLALVSASHLDQDFLVLGAQVPEPTMNVTASIWPGASSRGGEMADTDSSFDSDAFTVERADAAIRAGVASVLNGITGIVISLDQ
jgi:hypothetical protein